MRPVCDRGGCECWPLGNPTSEGPTWALEAGFKGQHGCWRALWLRELFYSPAYQPGASRKHEARLGSLRRLIAGAVCVGFRGWCSPVGLETVGAVNTPRLGRGLCGGLPQKTVGLGTGMQPTWGHLAGNWREKCPNFSLFLSLSVLLVSLIDQTQLDAPTGWPARHRAGGEGRRVSWGANSRALASSC